MDLSTRTLTQTRTRLAALSLLALLLAPPPAQAGALLVYPGVFPFPFVLTDLRWVTLIDTPEALASVTGTATDGGAANYNRTRKQPFMVAESGAGLGSNQSFFGSFAAAQYAVGDPGGGAPAIEGGLLLAYTFAVPGPGQTVDVSAYASTRWRSLVVDPVPTATVAIDPYLFTEGDASASMSFELLMNGAPVFQAAASLNAELLFLSGAFGADDFTLEPSGDGVRATLTTEEFTFAVPTLSIGDIVEFELRLQYDGHAGPGGAMEVGPQPVPEPATLLLTGLGLGAVIRRRRAAPLPWRRFAGPAISLVLRTPGPPSPG